MWKSIMFFFHTSNEVHLQKKKNKPHDVVSPPTVGGGTTYEVCLRSKKLPRNVVSPPTVGGGTTYELRLRNKKYLAMWSHHRQSVVVPHTRFTYEAKKTSWCGLTTDSRWWYHIRGSLKKQIKNSWCGLSTDSRWWYHMTRFIVELCMWYHHRLLVVRPHTRFFLFFS